MRGRRRISGMQERCDERRRTKKGSPRQETTAADRVNTFPGKDRSTKNPLQPSVTLSQPGDARAAGAKPPRARSARKILTATKKPGKKIQNQRIPVSHHAIGILLFTDGKKTLKTTASRPSDTSPGLPKAQGWQIPDVFPEKPGRFSPFRNPLYFQAINAFFSPFDALYDQLHYPFFTVKGTRLNWPVFSRLKRPISKNTRLKQKSWRGLAPLPLELPGPESGPVPLRRRIDHGKP